MASKRVLVTGACGFTGTNMISYLKRKGYDVLATDLRKEDRGAYYNESGSNHPIHYSDFPSRIGVEYISADLTKKGTLEPLFEREVDTVFHIASLYDYYAGWEELYRVNVLGAKNIAELSLKKGVRRFVHWSTAGVYGEPPFLPGDETAPFNPPNLYSKSKAEQEKVLWKMQWESGLNITVLRPAPIYGPRHRYGVYNVIEGVMKFGALGFTFIPEVYPKKRRPMFPSVHVEDVVRSAVFLSEREESRGEAYNVLSECIPQSDILKFIANEFSISSLKVPVWWPEYKLGAKVALGITKFRDKRARKQGRRPKTDIPMMEYVTHQYWFSNNKIKDLGFKFKYENPRDGLRDYIRWIKFGAHHEISKLGQWDWVVLDDE